MTTTPNECLRLARDAWNHNELPVVLRRLREYARYRFDQRRDHLQLDEEFFALLDLLQGEQVLLRVKSADELEREAAQKEAASKIAWTPEQLRAKYAE